MLDLQTENPIPLITAAKLVPPSRSGKRTHISTLMRWILTGSKSPSGKVVRLEAIRLGGRWLTSREALLRFSERLTPQFDGEPAPPPRSPAARTRASERAAKQLDAIGI